jgi:hypothetical protein
LKHRFEPTDNSALEVKINIRKMILSEIEHPTILDCFAGEGIMWQACYQGLEYFSIDKRGLSSSLKMDSSKFLRSSKLERYNFFDLDAWGSPWYHFWIIMNKRKFKEDEKIGIVLTDGLDFTMKMSNTQIGIKKLLNIPKEMRIPGLDRHANFIRSYLVKRGCDIAGVKILKSNTAQNSRGNVSYFGLLLVKN